MSRDLARRSIRSAVWLFGTGYAAFAFNMAANLVLARLVFPEDFGLFAAAFAVSELVGILAALSVPLALIHFGEDERHLFDTGAWLNLAIGAIGLAAAVVAGALFAEGGLASDQGIFLVILALARIPTLMGQVASAALEKGFRYRAVSTVNLVATTSSSLLALAMAWWGCGAFSLVGREVATAFLTWSLFGIVTPFRFTGRFDRATAGTITRFCTGMFVSRGLQIVLERFDRLVVGLLAGPHALGLYDRSRYVSEIGLVVSRPVDGLSFNLYSRLRDEPERLRQAFTVLNYFLVRFTLVLALLVLLCPREVLLLLLGRQWLEAAPTLRAMAPYAALIPIYLGLNQLLYGRGMIREVNRARLVQVGFFVPIFAWWVAGMGPSSAGLVLFLQLASGAGLMFACQRALLGPVLVEIVAVPLLAAAAAAAMFAPLSALLPAADTTGRAFLILLVPSALYVAVLLAIEGRRLRSRIAYLRQ